MIGSSDISFLLDRWQNERKGDVYIEMAKRRCDFFQEKAKTQGVVKDSHLLISVTVPDLETDILAMEQRREALKLTFANIRLYTQDVKDKILLSVLRKVWGRESFGSVSVNPHASLSEQILPGDFSVYEDNDIAYLKDDEAIIALDAEERPREWILGLMDLFLGNEARKGDLNAPGMLLTGRRGQLKYFSQFGNELAPHLGGGGTPAENYNVCIACIAGSGKSVLMEEMMLSTLGIGGKVFVLDYGKSFKNLCIELGGEYIEFDPSRPVSINPFSEVPTGDDQVSVEARADFLATFPVTLSTMAAPKFGTSDLQQTNLAMALRECWEAKGVDCQIDDIANWLLEQKDNNVANDLGRMLFNYTKNGAYGGLFSGKAAVTLNSDIVVIETDHL